MKRLMFLLLLLIVPFVSADTVSLDSKSDLCKLEYGLFSDCADLVSDSTNKFSEADFNSAVASADTVQNLDERLVEEDQNLARERINMMWSNILTLLLLVVEVFRILFYVVQLILLFYMPFWYVKLLNWVHRFIVSKVGGRK